MVNLSSFSDLHISEVVDVSATSIVKDTMVFIKTCLVGVLRCIGVERHWEAVEMRCFELHSDVLPCSLRFIWLHWDVVECFWDNFMIFRCIWTHIELHKMRLIILKCIWLSLDAFDCIGMHCIALRYIWLYWNCSICLKLYLITLAGYIPLISPDFQVYSFGCTSRGRLGVSTDLSSSHRKRSAIPTPQPVFATHSHVIALSSCSSHTLAIMRKFVNIFMIMIIITFVSF